VTPDALLTVEEGALRKWQLGSGGAQCAASGSPGAGQALWGAAAHPRSAGLAAAVAGGSLQVGRPAIPGWRQRKGAGVHRRRGYEAQPASLRRVKKLRACRCRRCRRRPARPPPTLLPPKALGPQQLRKGRGGAGRARPDGALRRLGAAQRAPAGDVRR
jgi:hypothetical protein